MSDLARRVEELEPCPFCGAIPEIHSGKWTISHPRGCYLRYVRSVALKNYLATSESIESWNRRALIAEAREEAERCTCRLERILPVGESCPLHGTQLPPASTSIEEPGLREKVIALPMEAKAEAGDFRKALTDLLRERFGAGDDGNEDYRAEVNGIVALFLLTRPAPAASTEGLRDWSKIRDYFDCLGDTEEEKQLRIRWVREMKAENRELRAKLDAALRGEGKPKEGKS